MLYIPTWELEVNSITAQPFDGPRGCERKVPPIIPPGPSVSDSTTNQSFCRIGREKIAKALSVGSHLFMPLTCFMSFEDNKVGEKSMTAVLRSLP